MGLFIVEQRLLCITVYNVFGNVQSSSNEGLLRRIDMIVT